MARRNRGTSRRPYVIINCAASLDGRIAFPDGSRARLSTDADLRRVHRLRNSVDAILVGVRTVLADDPSLSVKARYVRRGRRAPAKVVLDSSCRTPATARLFQSPGRVIIATTTSCRKGIPGAFMLRCGRRRVELAKALGQLSNLGLRRVLVEGGGEVIRSFLVGRTWDEMSVFLAPVLIGGRGAQAIAGGARDDAGFLPLGAQLVAARRFGGGVLVRLVPERRSRATA